MASIRNLNYVLNFLGILFIGSLVCEARVLTEITPGFVQTKGTEFELNGFPFLFNGFNSYWMMHVATDPKQRDKVSNVFSKASASGLTVCRTWAFSDGGDQALQVSPGEYDEQSLVNNYNDFGGRPQYIQWAKTAGVPVNKDDDFYTNPIVKNYYKNHVKRVLTMINTITRMTYKDDPTVMAWELINEPRCQVDYSGKTINVSSKAFLLPYYFNKT
ncbi:hypothetical protein L6164_016842 [Bauhinia variegata]|uniref:Uncharacterized protein n=1 Tax=Bauhinia variegata TaxID=167791 RepID=A0ACB9N7L0_BAUVA|nr:hypothetical protein L6164_016842 [Bauhinia variegata]